MPNDTQREIILKYGGGAALMLALVFTPFIPSFVDTLAAGAGMGLAWVGGTRYRAAASPRP